jgi:Periplasmic binding protein
MEGLPLIYRIFLTTTLLLVILSTHAQPVIRIGAPLPLTGNLALEAAKQQRGYDLWADIINQRGGINVDGQNHTVKIVYTDYQSDSGEARGAVESLISKDNVHLLFAPYGSMAAREASVEAQKHQIPMIAVTASSYQAYSRGYKYLFGTFTPNETLIEPIMDLVQQKARDQHKFLQSLRCRRQRSFPGIAAIKKVTPGLDFRARLHHRPCTGTGADVRHRYHCPCVNNDRRACLSGISRCYGPPGRKHHQCGLVAPSGPVHRQ